MQVVDQKSVVELEDTLARLREEQRHLAFWLDRQTDSLGVGIGNLDNGSARKISAEPITD